MKMIQRKIATSKHGLSSYRDYSNMPEFKNIGQMSVKRLEVVNGPGIIVYFVSSSFKIF